MGFDLSQYEEVKDRLPRFFEQYPDGRVTTDLISDPENLETVVFRASLFALAEDQGLSLPLSTGWAFEREGQGYINKTSHVENCETSAIGRALANIGLHGSQRPSREEMQKAQKETQEASTSDESSEPSEPEERQEVPQNKVRAYFAAMGDLGAERDQAKRWAKETYELESFKDITLEQLRSVYELYKEMLEREQAEEEDSHD